jgi:putative transposase
MDEQALNRQFYLPRLPREYYQGDAVVHWTFPIAYRERGWLNPGFHATFRELMLHAAGREGIICPTYCLMPDHLHFVWMGFRLKSDQLNAILFLRTYLKRALEEAEFQHQAHDHVLKEKERRKNAFALVCGYILENPMRAGLIGNGESWPFSGALVLDYPKLHPLETASGQNSGSYMPP